MGKFKVGDTVRVLCTNQQLYEENCYGGHYGLGDLGKVSGIAGNTATLEGDIFTACSNIKLSSLWLVKSANAITSHVQYKNKPPTHPNMYVIDEWNRGASIQGRTEKSDKWYTITGCPSMTMPEYRVDPDCIVQPVCNKARTKELLDTIQSAKDKLQSMEEGK